MTFAAMLWTWTAPARAEPSATERATAQELFDQGRELMQAGNYREACPKFEQSQRLDPGGGTLLNLAVCHEKEGRIATAWGELHDALSVARRDGRKDREKLASERIQAIAPNLPRLSVHVPAPVPDGVEVRVDGSLLSREAWDVATPFDPGVHEVTTGRAGVASWSQSIELHEGETQALTVVIHEAPAPPAVVIEAPRPAPAAPAPPPTWNAPLPRSSRSAAFYAVGGVGLASLVTSAVAGVLALGAHSKSEETCIAARHYCTDDNGINEAKRARTLALVSTATLFTGLAGVSVAWFLPLHYERPKSAGHIQFAPLPRGGGEIGWYGRF